MSLAVAFGWMYAAPRQFGSVIFEAPPILRSHAFTPAAYPLTIVACLRARPGLRGEQLLDDLAVVQVGDEGVDLEVGAGHRDLVVVLAVRAEVARALAAAGQHRVGERADRGLGGGVPGAEAERAEVLGHDVRDAVLGAGDRRAVRRRGGVRLPGDRAGDGSRAGTSPSETVAAASRKRVGCMSSQRAPGSGVMPSRRAAAPSERTSDSVHTTRCRRTAERGVNSIDPRSPRRIVVSESRM